MPGENARIALVGPPNVGKSLLFNQLCHRYEVVSNYPGTTVEIARGQARLGSQYVEVIDTPGSYSVNAVTDEEKLTCRLLLQEKVDLIVQVADARNLPRMLHLTAELVEAGLSMVLVVNFMDEARRAGIYINPDELSKRLGMPVITASLVNGCGVNEVYREIPRQLNTVNTRVKYARPVYPAPVENYLKQVSSVLKTRSHAEVSSRFFALLLLNPDPRFTKELFRSLLKPDQRVGYSYNDLQLLVAELQASRRKWAQLKIKGSYRVPDRESPALMEKLSELMVNPWTGSIILFLVLYLGFYQVVGVWSAGYLVDYLEGYLFGEFFVPFLQEVARSHITAYWLREFIAGPYGIINLGIRYTFAIILPLVFSFFLVFSFIEDSGYLPRISYLFNNWLNRVGLNGKAVIPLALGLGCGTLAVLVTRTLDTRKERLLTSFLLSLAVPCSAQLAVIMGLLAGAGRALWIWLLVVFLVIVITSYLASMLMGGEPPAFCMEIPPLRLPRLSAVLKKTLARTRWYLREIFPLFLITSVLIWGAQMTGLLEVVINLFQYPLAAVDLPREAAVILVMGFVRRDYGAAGLFEMAQAGVLSLSQILVAGILLTLFLPCVAQFLVLIREQGASFALLVAVLTSVISWGTACLLSLLL